MQNKSPERAAATKHKKMQYNEQTMVVQKVKRTVVQKAESTVVQKVQTQIKKCGGRRGTGTFMSAKDIPDPSDHTI